MVGSAGFRRWTVAWLAVLVGLGACDVEPDPVTIELEDSVLGVYSMLVEGERRVRVLVVRFSEELPVGNGGVLPVDHAEVRLLRDGRASQLGPTDAEECVGTRSVHVVQAGDGCYTARLDRPVAAGEVFDLRVRLADGGLVEGRAVVPGTPGVRLPEPGDTIRLSGERFPRGRTTIRLTPPPDAASLELAVRNSKEPDCRVSLGSRGASSLDVLGTGGTVRVLPTEADSVSVTVEATCLDDEGHRLPIGTLGSSLHALAHDTAYTRYATELVVDGHDLPADQASAGLTGAVGYFAASGRATVPIEVVDEEAALADGREPIPAAHSRAEADAGR